MGDFQITCVNKQVQPNHHHIVGVGISGHRVYTVAEIYQAMDAGDTFHTGTHAGRNYAAVAKFDCTYCGRATLRSHADGQYNNNLDNLGTC